MTKTKTIKTLPADFAALNALLPLRPINDRIDLGNAMEVVDRLALLPTRTADQEDYLETLSTLIERYEADTLPTIAAKPLDAIKYLMEANNMSASDLGRVLGDRAVGPKVLAGKRELSKAHIAALSQRFKVSPAIFFA